LFIEEPVLPEFTHHFGLIARSTSTPIATGERLFSRGEYKDLLRSGIAVAQPDVSHAGGISEMRRIASMAETYDVAMAPHCAIGPIALAASLQVDFATPNFLVQEQIIGAGDPGEVLADLVDYSDLKPKDGYIELMKKPGLGIEVDEKAMRAAAVEFNKSRQPEWIQKDGSYAEW
jgi:galactonate dehydratase